MKLGGGSYYRELEENKCAWSSERERERSNEFASICLCIHVCLLHPMDACLSLNTLFDTDRWAPLFQHVHVSTTQLPFGFHWGWLFGGGGSKHGRVSLSPFNQPKKVPRAPQPTAKTHKKHAAHAHFPTNPRRSAAATCASSSLGTGRGDPQSPRR